MKIKFLSMFLVAAVVLPSAYAKRPLIFPQVLPEDEPVLDGRRIALKAKEFALLQCLYRHRNTIVKKDVLFGEVWGDTFFSDGTLNVHVRKLREKLEEDPNNPKMLKTVWGTGYILDLADSGEAGQA